VPDLSLDEGRVVAGLDEVGDVGVPEAVQSELFREPDKVACGREGIAECAKSDAITAFAWPQCC